jgi:glycosyltransferase involved in cell wall biosynthesis
MARLTALYRDLQPDLIHHFTLRCVLYGSIAARLAGASPVVNGVTGLGYLFSSDEAKVRLLRTAVLSALYVITRGMRPWWIFQNPDDKALFQRWGIPDVDMTRVILGSGVDMDRFHVNGEAHGLGDEEPPLIVFPARMLWSKGAGVFAEAAQVLQEKGISARMVLVGDRDPDNPESISRDQLEEWDATGGVEWWGHQDDMPAVFGQTDIVCLPSMYREGVPKVLIEAASAARPIVTTDMPGCREIVRDGWNGCVVPPGSADAVADALSFLIENPDRRREMGQRGRELVHEQFSIDQVVGSTLDLHGKALASG